VTSPYDGTIDCVRLTNKLVRVTDGVALTHKSNRLSWNKSLLPTQAE
jgi:hypothetical protein